MTTFAGPEDWNWIILLIGSARILISEVILDFLKGRIKQISAGYPTFYHREWSEYAYVSMNGNIKSSFYTWKRNWKQACTVKLVSKELKDSYVEYVLLYDTIANRITINEVQAEHGSLRLMKNVSVGV